ncbi:MAG: enoyl-[acyl-carrier-protein] reductase FabL [Anaerolineae bacterium]|nr:enoyl-[acyl-carrier-protein] reductase FabL [Anaerolineae bacterium]
MEQPKRFEGKIALVTGSSRGIGRTIARRFAAEGADVVLNYFRNREAADEAAAEIVQLGQRVRVIRADMGNAEDVERLIDEVGDTFGGLDILIHNAASGYNRPVMEQRVKGWDWTMNINARAALFLAQRAAPLMVQRGGGAIVNMSSVGAQRVLPEYVVVGASKAALEAVTRYLAVELSPQRIVVNAVSAGLVRTDALKHFPNMREQMEEVFAQAVERTPAGQVLTAEEVAAVVAFLCSPEAFMIRGQTIIIDGGATLGF